VPTEKTYILSCAQDDIPEISLINLRIRINFLASSRSRSPRQPSVR
jgi:hypothetical protein